MPTAPRTPLRARLLARMTVGFLPEVAPWIGTTAGGSIISSANGRGIQIAIGSVVVALGVLPHGLRAWAGERARRSDDELDARERIVSTFAVSAMQEAPDLEGMPRKDRIAFVDDRIEVLLDDVAQRVFDGKPDVRVVFYRLSEDAHSLIAEAPAGRDDAPRDFDTGHPNHGLTIARLSSDEPYTLVPDTSKVEPRLDTQGRAYRSFVAAPIRSATAAYGMLTVDSTAPDVFDTRDAEMLVSIATIMAFYLAARERGKQKRRSTVDEDDAGGERQ